MSLSDLSSLGSFVSGVAVLVSLVFLYFQVRQVNEQVRLAERNQRATIAQVRTSYVVNVALRNCEPSMADAFTRAMNGDADLTVTQLQQFLSYARAVFAVAEDTLIQHRLGQLDDRTYSAWLALFGHTIARPAFRFAWKTQVGRPSAGHEFAEFVEKLIAETPALETNSAVLLDWWRSDFAEPAAPATAVVP